MEARVILVLHDGLSSDAIAHVERAIRGAGGDPKRLISGQRVALEARGADVERLRSVEGVSYVLESKCAFPKVALPASGARRHVRIGRAVVGDGSLAIVAGPCAVESREQLEACASAVAKAGARLLRGGAFKPRTSPYSFQGLADEGLRLLRGVADREGLAVITEVMEPAMVPLVAEYADALQIGSRNMQNFALLKAAGRAKRPIVLKRGMSATLEEWLLAAEYVADAGNDDIVLCERGVRSFDPAARNLLDLAAIPLLRERTSLPLFVDPSHGVGVRSAIPSAARAAVAIGADGVMLEIHPDPARALSDGFQAILASDFGSLAKSLTRVHESLAP
jgi:3-deoxy-7-phosphoheptulonate synthase